MKRILVVDDDKDIITLIEEMLAPHSYEVVTAENGARALEQTNRHHFDLILMDNRMPLLSGIWYCNAFKRKPNTKNIPIVLVSGELNDSTRHKAKEAGASDFLMKPFQTDELLRTVEKNIL